MEPKDQQRLQELETLLRINQFSQPSSEDEIDLKELFNVIWQGKWFIIAITMFFAIASIIFALSQPNVYKATVLLAPANSDSGAGGLSRLAGQVGGLASLAGINLNGNGLEKTDLALEVLKSRKFIERFVEENQLLVPLIAVKNWDRNNNKLVIDDDIYDHTKGVWMFENQLKPSSWEGYKAFSKILSVSKDKQTGVVTVNIEYFSPELAKLWLNNLIEELNKTIKLQDKQEAQNSIDYLTEKLKKTQITDMQNVFYQLIEEQIKVVMLAEVSKEYVFKIIDPASVPDTKESPRRALIVIMITFFGGVLSVMSLLVRYYFIAPSDKSSAKNL